MTVELGREHPTSLVLADFTFLTANLVMDMDKIGGSPFYISNGFCTTKGFFTLAKLEVERGYSYAFGTRMGQIPICCRMDESGGEIEGRYKVIGGHPTGYPMVDLGTYHTSAMDSTAPASRRVNPAPRLVAPWVLERGFIMVSFRPDIDDKTLVYNDADNILGIPITKKPNQTRAMYFK